MDTEKCRALLCTIQTGSLSAAAEQLGYTPSGISRMMASLEAETGFPLLVRSRSGVVPTKECQQLLPAFRALAKWGEQFVQQASEIQGLDTGTVTVGISSSGYYRWLSELIFDFCKSYPNIEVQVLDGLSSELVVALEERAADLCLISRREGEFRWLPLAMEEMVAWVPAEHPLAKRAVFPLSAFASEPYIDICRPSETDCSITFEKFGIHPNTRFSATDPYSAYLMVEAGLGISLNQRMTAADWNGKVAIMSLDPPQPVEVGLAIPETMSPAAAKFADFAEARAGRH